jgi:hypothetical protein
LPSFIALDPSPSPSLFFAAPLSSFDLSIPYFPCYALDIFVFFAAFELYLPFFFQSLRHPSVLQSDCLLLQLPEVGLLEERRHACMI